MTTKLSEEQRQALHRSAGRPVPVEDDQTHRVYVIIEENLHRRAMRALEQIEDVAAIRAGFDAAAKGDVATVDEIDTRIRKKLGFPPAQ